MRLPLINSSTPSRHEAVVHAPSRPLLRSAQHTKARPTVTQYLGISGTAQARQCVPQATASAVPQQTPFVPNIAPPQVVFRRRQDNVTSTNYARGSAIEVAYGVSMVTNINGSQSIVVHRPKLERFTYGLTSADGQRIVAERATALSGHAQTGAQAAASSPYASPDWIEGVNNYLGARIALRWDKNELSQVAAQAVIASNRTDLSTEQHQFATGQLRWTQERIAHIDRILANTAMPEHKGLRDPDLIHPGDKVIVSFKPAEAHVLTPTEVKLALLTQAKQEAPHVGHDDRYINDPLRNLAQTDPISYAKIRLSQNHAGNTQWMRAIDQSAPAARREYTQARVKEELGKNHISRALDILKINLDATANTTERRQLFDYAGKHNFSSQNIKQQIDQLPNHKKISSMSPNMHAEQVGQWILNTTKNGVPPEVATVMYGVIRQTIMQPWTDKDGDIGPKFYNGMSRLVQANDLQPHAAEKIAPAVTNWFKQKLGSASHFGIADELGARTAVADGDIKLSLQLYQSLSSDHNSRWRNALSLEIEQGQQQAYSNWQSTHEAAQVASADLRFVIKHFVANGDLQTVAQLTRDFRSKYPDKADALDQAQHIQDKQSGVVAQLAENTSLFLANHTQIANSAGSEKTRQWLDEIGNDAELMRTMQESQALSRNLFWQSGGDDSAAVNAWIKVGISPYAKGVRAMKNLTDFFIQQHFKVTMDQMLTDFGVDPKLDGKFADRLDKVSLQIKLMTDRAGIQGGKTQQLINTLHELSTQVRALTRSNTVQRERELIRQLDLTIQTDGNKKLFGSVLRKWNPTDNRLLLGRALRSITFAAYGIGLSEAMSRVAIHNDWKDVVSAGAYSGSLTLQGTEIAAGLRGINPAKDWALWTRYLDRASPVLSAIPDAMTGVKDWQKGDYVGVGLDVGIVTANGAALLAKLPIAAEFGATFGPWALLPIGVISLARAAWSVGYERIQQANQFEYSKNPAVAHMVKALGYSDEQANQLLNQTGNGISPMVALQQWSSYNGLSHAKLQAYLQRLQPAELKELVSESHYLIDNHLNKNSRKLPEQSDRDLMEVVDSPENASPLDGKHASHDPYFDRADSLFEWGKLMSAHSIAYTPVMQRQPLTWSHLQPSAPPRTLKHPLITQGPQKLTVHTVRAGETLWGIAGNSRVGLNYLYSLNTRTFDNTRESET
jgi:LysM domain